MIIKSMSRKAPSFRQLLSYFEQGHDPQEACIFSRNLYADSTDRQAIIDEFETNFGYLPTRVNGNALFHEVLVLDQHLKLSPQQCNRLLLELANRYCKARAPHQLVVGRVHHDKDHPHMHLMISANAVKSPRRVRLAKADFATVQKDLEQYVLDTYPELGIQAIYTRDPERQRAQRPKTSNREGELERRTRQPSKKKQLSHIVQHSFQVASSMEDLEQRLQAANLQLYQRGKQIGIEPLPHTPGRRYRLATLGVDQDYQHLMKRLAHARPPRPTLASVRQPQQPSGDSHQASQTLATAEQADSRLEALIQHRTQQAHFAEQQLTDFEGERS